MSITVSLPEKVLRLLKEKAEAEGRSIEELILISLLDKYAINDPETRAELYLKLSEKYLSEAEKLLRREDYLQASEKAWGAVAEMVKALAAKEGIDLKSHGELHRYIAKLVEKTKDIELRRLWSVANELHRNFYEGWLPPELVKGYIEDVKELINKLRKLLT